MHQSDQVTNSAENCDASSRMGEYIFIAFMVMFAVVALGISTSFELAAVFATSLGAVLTFAAAATRLLAPSNDQKPQRVQPRLLQPDSETAG